MHGGTSANIMLNAKKLDESQEFYTNDFRASYGPDDETTIDRSGIISGGAVLI